MKLNIRGDKIKVTESIKKYAEEKLERLNKYFENPENINANVLIKVKNNMQIVEVTIPTKEFTLRREEASDDLYASIDLVVDKLERQIRKNKTKILKKAQEVVDFDMVMFLEEEVDEINDVIVKRKEVDSKPMSEEEAILQLELINHDFYVFKNVDENCISVLYKRKNNDYGIINVRN